MVSSVTLDTETLPDAQTSWFSAKKLNSAELALGSAKELYRNGIRIWVKQAISMPQLRKSTDLYRCCCGSARFLSDR